VGHGPLQPGGQIVPIILLFAPIPPDFQAFRRP